MSFQIYGDEQQDGLYWSNLNSYKRVLQQYGIQEREVEEEIKKLNTFERRKRLLSENVNAIGFKKLYPFSNEEEIMNNMDVSKGLNKMILSIALSNVVKRKM